MYECRGYFIIYDFVKAHCNFADPGRDVELLEPEVCKTFDNKS